MSIVLGAAAVVNDNATTQTIAVTYNSLTSGRGLVAMVIFGDFGAEDITSITVTGESNMTLLGTHARSGVNHSTQMAYLPAMTSSGNKTITATISQENQPVKKLIVQEVYDDVTGEIVEDGVANGLGTAANPSINLTTGTDNDAILAVLISEGSEPTTGTGFTLLHSGASFAYERAQYDLDAGTAGSVAVGWTTPGTGDWSIAAAAFKGVAGAGAVSPTVNEDVTVAESVSMKMHLGNVDINESVTVAESLTMHMPIGIRMEKLS